MDGQPRLTDLVPRKVSTLVLLFLTGLTLIAGLEALYYWMPQLAAKARDGRIASFDLDGEGSLAVWFSSAVLSLAGLTALLIYSIRRQKPDDYNGRYRIWLWAAFCWFLMSLDETASLHEGFKEMMALSTGHRLMGDGSIWWVMGYSLLLGGVGLRLLLEMRENRVSTTALGMAAACFATAVVAQLGWIMPDAGAREVMVEEGCEMLGDLLLLLAMGIHARWVVLGSQGLLPARAEKPKKKPRKNDVSEEEPGASEAAAPSRATRSPEPARAAAATPVKKPASAPPSPAPTSRGSARVDEPESPPERHKMTKAERKALRRQQREEQEDYR